MESDLTKASEEFERWRDSLPATHWTKYDLSACRLGWDAALQSSQAMLEEAELVLERVIAVADRETDVFRAARAFLAKLKERQKP